MAKQYSDRAMETDKGTSRQTFFFPKKTPPATVEAGSVEEAEALLDKASKE